MSNAEQVGRKQAERFEKKVKQITRTHPRRQTDVALPNKEFVDIPKETGETVRLSAPKRDSNPETQDTEFSVKHEHKKEPEGAGHTATVEHYYSNSPRIIYEKGKALIERALADPSEDTPPGPSADLPWMHYQKVVKRFDAEGNEQDELRESIAAGDFLSVLSIVTQNRERSEGITPEQYDDVMRLLDEIDPTDR